MKENATSPRPAIGNVIAFPPERGRHIQRVLVAGGAGFLGSHLCDTLLKAQYHVTCIDNLATGRLENIKPLLDNPQFTFRHHDIRTSLALKVDAIFNFACPASPPAYQADPVGTMMTNVIGTRNLLELARRRKAVFVQASTSEVYGDPLVSPQKEEYLGNVSTTGHVDTGHDRQIIIDNVDLTAGGPTDQHELIGNLIHDGKLKVDAG